MPGKKYLYPLLLLFSLLLIWESLGYMMTHLQFILPAPSKVFGSLFINPQRYITHSLVTIKEILWSLGLAFCISFPVAWLMSRSHSARMTIQPFFVMIQCMPMFTLAPIMIVWFDWSLTAIIIPTVLMLLFPLILNIYQGLRSTPQSLIDFFTINQANEWQLFCKLRLPFALPHIFAGLRIAAAVAGISATAGEWAGGQEGLGVLMHESRYNTDLETTFGAFFCLTIIGILLYGSIIMMETYLCFSKRKSKRLASSFYSILLLIMVACIAPSCEKVQPNRVNLLLDWFPNPNHVPLYAGIDKGYFKKYGIDLQIRKLRDPSDTIPYLSSNQADLAIYYMPNAIRAATRGAEFKMVGVLIKEPLEVLLYRNDGKIVNFEDLNNKVIAYAHEGLNTAYLDEILAHKKIKLRGTKKISFDLVTAIATKSVTASLGAYRNIEPVHLKHLGIQTHYFELKEFGVPTYYELIILANHNFLTNNPNMEQRVKEALHESILYCKAHPEEAFAAYERANPDKGLTTLIWEKAAWKETIPLLADNQTLEKECWNDFSTWMKKQRIISDIPRAESYM